MVMKVHLYEKGEVWLLGQVTALHIIMIKHYDLNVIVANAFPPFAAKTLFHHPLSLILLELLGAKSHMALKKQRGEYWMKLL